MRRLTCGFPWACWWRCWDWRTRFRRQALRFAYADRPGFMPDGDDPDRTAMMKALGQHDWPAVLDNAGKVFEHNYGDGIAHRVAGMASRPKTPSSSSRSARNTT